MHWLAHWSKCPKLKFKFLSSCSFTLQTKRIKNQTKLKSHQNRILTSKPFIKQLKVNTLKPEISSSKWKRLQEMKRTIIQEEHAERKLALEGVNLPHFLFQSLDKIIEPQQLIGRIGDRGDLVEKISDRLGNKSGPQIQAQLRRRERTHGRSLSLNFRSPWASRRFFYLSNTDEKIVTRCDWEKEFIGRERGIKEGRQRECEGMVCLGRKKRRKENKRQREKKERKKKVGFNECEE